MEMRRLQTMPIGELIDMFNEPCGQRDCRFTSRRVNDDWCPRHRGPYREIERRQNAIVAPESNLPLHLDEADHLDRAGGR